MIQCTFEKTISVDDVLPLLYQTDWAKHRIPEHVQIMLNHSVNLGAWDGEKLVGYARIITDHSYRAFIEDVIVDEAYRGQGVGRRLVESMVIYLHDIQEIFLACSDENMPFYEKFGFKRTPHNHMHIWKPQIKP